MIFLQLSVAVREKIMNNDRETVMKIEKTAKNVDICKLLVSKRNLSAVTICDRGMWYISVVTLGDICLVFLFGFVGGSLVFWGIVVC